MPEHYIVTTTTYPPGSPMPSGQTRTEAATLDEARLIASGIWQKHLGYRKYGYTEDDLRRYGDWAVPESGGTVGPLPDGTMIEVRPA